MHNNLKRFVSLISFILTVAIFLGLLPLNELRADANTHSEYYLTLFEVVYDQNSTWNNTTQGGFTVTNTSDESVDSWKFEIEYLYPVIVNNIWDANLIGDPTLPATTIIVENTASNGFIASGNSINFGIIAQGEESAPIAPIAVRLVTEGNEDIVPTPSVTPYPTEETTPTPIVTEIPEEITEVFPYVIFSGSNNYDFTFNGWKSDILGDVYTGSNFQYNGSELTLDGKVQSVGNINASGWNITIGEQEEHAEEIDMPNWGYFILERGNELPVIDTSRFTTEDPILTDGYCYVDGDIVISGTTFEGDAIIIANGDITYNINEISGDGRVLLYSENGNITINGTEININGIMYAPNGRVSINAYKTTLNGRIVSDEFFYSGSILNCYADPSDLDMFYPLPEVNVIASTHTASIGDEIYYTIEISENNVYEILYRLNGEDVTVDLPENENEPIVYNLNTTNEGTFIFEAYIIIAGEEILLSSDTVTITVPNTSTPTPTEETTVTPTPTENPISTVTPTVEPTDEITPTITNVPTPVPTSGPVIIPTPEEYSDDYYYLDSDSDGLLDYIELMYGTDINDEDTDDDGLLDGDEIYINLNPLNPDTDRDNVCDFDEDYDEDGITNGNEYVFGTCMFAADSDYDGVIDSDEIFVYDTDPRNIDSDNDGIIDGDEVILGLNPVSVDSDNDGIEDNFELFHQRLYFSEIDNNHPQELISIEIEGDISGYISNNTTIEDVYEKDVYCTNVVGLVGIPFSIESSGYFEMMTLTLTYDENVLMGVDESNLGVLWFDESTGFFVIQENAQIDVSMNTITLELNHFSTYMLVDMTVWNSVSPIDYSNSNETTGIDYYLAFDVSQNMTINARNNAINEFMNIISGLSPEDRICVFYFDTNYAIDGMFYANNETDLNELSQRTIRNLRGASLGGDYGSLVLPFQITEAIINQAVDDIGNNKALLIFTNDTEVIHTNTNVNDMLYRKNVGGFTVDFIITENLNESSWTFAWQYAKETNSGYYKYTTCNNLYNVINNNYRVVSCWENDDDNDGIPNFIEIGGIYVANGQIIYTDPNNPDSDNDGIFDGEEIAGIYALTRVDNYLSISINNVVVFETTYGDIPSSSQYYVLRNYYNWVSNGNTIFVGVLISDPNLPDSDRDGYLDYEDARPTVVNPDMVYVFANPDFFDPAATRVEMYRNEFGLNVEFVKFEDWDSFNFCWNGIGLSEDYYNNDSGDKPYGERYYYNVTYVCICTHGSPDSLLLNANSAETHLKISATQGNTADQLIYKRIESLNLYACSCGVNRGENMLNIAESFLQEGSGIHQVIAAGTTLSGIGNHYFFKGYDDINICTQNEYEHLRNSVNGDSYNGSSYVLNGGYETYANPHGFLLFVNGADTTPTPYYGDSDLYLGTLNITERNYENNGPGVVVYNYIISEQFIAGVYNDPVVN